MHFDHFCDHQREDVITWLEAPGLSSNEQGITGKLPRIGDVGSDGAEKAAMKFPEKRDSPEGNFNSLSVRKMQMLFASRWGIRRTRSYFEKIGGVSWPSVNLKELL